MNRRGKEELYVAFVNKYRDPDLNPNLKPKIAAIVILRGDNKKEVEKNALFWAKLSRSNPDDAQAVKVHMPNAQFEQLFPSQECSMEMKEHFLAINETYKPTQAPSLVDIATQTLKNTLREKEHPEYKKIKKSIPELAPMEIRELFFEKKRILEKKPKLKDDMKQSPSEMENETPPKPTGKK